MYRLQRGCRSIEARSVCWEVLRRLATSRRARYGSLDTAATKVPRSERSCVTEERFIERLEEAGCTVQRLKWTSGDNGSGFVGYVPPDESADAYVVRMIDGDRYAQEVVSAQLIERAAFDIVPMILDQLRHYLESHDQRAA